MGVPGLGSWFMSQVPSAHSSKRQTFGKQPGSGLACEHLYIDAPYILHVCIRGGKSPRDMYQKLFRKFDSVLNFCRPTKSVVIALDGVAPLAKLVTQRQRRMAEDIKVGAETAVQKGNHVPIGRPGLTPGCPLLAHLQDALAYYIGNRLARGLSHGVHFELSGADAPGEAELKLLDRIMRPWADVLPADRHIIFAGDSDMVLMAGFLPANMHISILHENNAPKAKSPVMWNILSMDKLNSAWQRKHSFMQGAAMLQSAKKDLAFLAIIGSGNDYVRSLPPTLNRLWNAYLDVRSQPDWGGRHLVHQTGNAVAFDAALLHAVMQKMKMPTYSSKQLRGHAEPEQYLQAVQWVIEMYARGVVTDWRFHLSDLGATIQGLLQYLKSVLDSHSSKSSPNPLVLVPTEQRKQSVPASPVQPAAFALSLLGPRTGHTYAPSALQHFMRAGSSIAHLYNICETCDMYRSTMRDLAVSLAQAQLTEMKAYKGGDKMASLATSPLHKATEQFRNKLRSQAIEKEKHMHEAHPPQDFPVEEVEAAVQTVPKSAFTPHEQRYLHFGPAFCFWALGVDQPTALSVQGSPIRSRTLPHLSMPLEPSSSSRSAPERRQLHRMPLPTPALPSQPSPLQCEYVTVDVQPRAVAKVLSPGSNVRTKGRVGPASAQLQLASRSLRTYMRCIQRAHIHI